MAQVWNVLDRLDGEGIIALDDERRVTVRIRGDNLEPQELIRLAQHLLEVAGASTHDVVLALGSLDFDPPRRQ